MINISNVIPGKRKQLEFERYHFNNNNNKYTEWVRSFNLQKTYKSKWLVAHFSSGIYYIRWTNTSTSYHNHMQSCHTKKGKKLQKRRQKLICTLKQKRSICCNCKSTFPMIKILGTNHFYLIFFCHRNPSFILFENRNNWFRRKYESKREQKQKHEKMPLYGSKKSIVHLQIYIEKLR